MGELRMTAEIPFEASYYIIFGIIIGTTASLLLYELFYGFGPTKEFVKDKIVSLSGISTFGFFAFSAVAYLNYIPLAKEKTELEIQNYLSPNFKINEDTLSFNIKKDGQYTTYLELDNIGEVPIKGKLDYEILLFTNLDENGKETNQNAKPLVYSSFNDAEAFFPVVLPTNQKSHINIVDLIDPEYIKHIKNYNTLCVIHMFEFYPAFELLNFEVQNKEDYLKLSSGIIASVLQEKNTKANVKNFCNQASDDIKLHAVRSYKDENLEHAKDAYERIFNNKNSVFSPSLDFILDSQPVTSPQSSD